jgi:glycosyltransferase involved in cell wall biosynthesis
VAENDFVDKKNLFFLSQFKTRGGAEKVNDILVEHLNDKYNIKQFYIFDENNLNNEQKSFNIKKRDPIQLLLPYSLIYSIIKYRQVVKKGGCNVSISFLILDNLINIFANTNTQVNTVISVHTTLSKRYSGKIYYPIVIKLIAFFYSKANCIIAISSNIRQDLINNIKIPDNKIIILYNPIDIKKIISLSKENIEDLNLDEKIPVIIYVGRLEKNKGQWHLIRALRLLKTKIQFKLIVCGEGEFKPTLEKMVKLFNLEKEVIFTGWVNNPYKYIARSDVFVLTSELEAFPCSIIEALALKKQIVVSDCEYGPREILDNGNLGVIVPMFDSFKDPFSSEIYQDETILAEKILNVINKEIYFNESQLFERAMEFDVEKTILKYEDLIDNLN